MPPCLVKGSFWGFEDQHSHETPQPLYTKGNHCQVAGNGVDPQVKPPLASMKVGKLGLARLPKFKRAKKAGLEGTEWRPLPQVLNGLPPPKPPRGPRKKKD